MDASVSTSCLVLFDSYPVSRECHYFVHFFFGGLPLVASRFPGGLESITADFARESDTSWGFTCWAHVVRGPIKTDKNSR